MVPCHRVQIGFRGSVSGGQEVAVRPVGDHAPWTGRHGSLEGGNERRAGQGGIEGQESELVFLGQKAEDQGRSGVFVEGYATDGRVGGGGWRRGGRK